MFVFKGPFYDTPIFGTRQLNEQKEEEEESGTPQHFVEAGCEPTWWVHSWDRNEKRGYPGCLGDLLGMTFPTQLYRDYNKPL